MNSMGILKGWPLTIEMIPELVYTYIHTHPPTHIHTHIFIIYLGIELESVGSGHDIHGKE